MHPAVDIMACIPVEPPLRPRRCPHGRTSLTDRVSTVL